MRYERKYILEEKNICIVSNHLKTLGFFREYPIREVNSIYYDTMNFALFNSSEAGYSSRAKIRIRWYDNSDKQHLEYKIKEAELGKKNYENDISIFENCTQINMIDKSYSKLINRNIPKVIDCIYYPNLAVSYKRDYLISSDNLTRLTFDYDIRFAKILNYGNQYKINCWKPAENSVLEIKYNAKTSNQFFVSKLAEQLNLNLSRFSKYCQAVQYLY